METIKTQKTEYDELMELVAALNSAANLMGTRYHIHSGPLGEWIEDFSEYVYLDVGQIVAELDELSRAITEYVKQANDGTKGD